MGKSWLPPIVGLIEIKQTDGKVVQVACHIADNKTGMAQELAKSIRDGKPIVAWKAQTRKGIQILGGFQKSVKDVKLPKMVDCPICNKHGCPVCNYSGMAKPGAENKWMSWQLEQMRTEYNKEKK